MRFLHDVNDDFVPAGGCAIAIMEPEWREFGVAIPMLVRGPATRVSLLPAAELRWARI
jgi:hypothetical protein